ncbi:transmembrane prolyl 4-hydroxylase-like [Actinia tenebrosa]|uniref:Transmembrane prolyl 4-hydroxylase-like n=1 Tax=Actinia tenebrosa TaxID=6105 RepID=A0A6P8HDD2_ACTTE|nr:transmembrane prolyl 4-hydroxylase-like [Actinia tenebrosa]
MCGKRILLLVFMVVLTPAAKYIEDKNDQSMITQTSSRFCSLLSSNCHHLFSRRRGFEVGHIQFIHFKGKQYEIVTRSLRPLMFEIPGFLSNTECDHIVKLAVQKGLETSKTLAEYSRPVTPAIMDLIISRYKRIGRRFANHLGSVKKMREFINQAEGLYPRKADAEKIFKMFDVNKDSNITEDELFLAPDNVIQSLYNCLEEYKSNPIYAPRYSTNTWLTMSGKSLDNILRELQEKIEKVTNLPKHIVEGSEDLQIVHYSVDGHFHGHYDSTEDGIGRNLPCCKQQGVDPKSCHLCRYITILFYLNDVTRGGETVFPAAGAKNVYLNQSSNLSLHCHNANIVMKPKKGTAIMWYNHHLDPKTGLLGNLDVYSLHGGCDVLEGSKWIANRWINIPKDHPPLP